jgi:hypothetical protein
MRTNKNMKRLRDAKAKQRSQTKAIWVVRAVCAEIASKIVSHDKVRVGDEKEPISK